MPRAQKQTQVPKDFSSVAKIRKKHLRRKKKKRVILDLLLRHGDILWPGVCVV